jgi:hypothetical protein
MAFVDSVAMDAGLENIRSAANRLVLLSGQPNNFTEANTTGTTTGTTAGNKKLAEATISSANLTIAAGDVANARKVTLAALTSTAAPLGGTNGTATHYALLNTTGSRLIQWGTMTNVAITNGVRQDTNAVKVWEILQPTVG